MLVLLLQPAWRVEAKVSLPSVLSSDMVLQRESLVNIWGKADPGAKVKVRTSWDNKIYCAKAGSDSLWTVKVKTGKAGGPYTITISDGDKLVLDNILLGEVWVCSGQSNMEMPLCGFIGQKVEGGAEEIMHASAHPEIRLFKVPMTASDTPAEDCPGAWKQASPASASEFSAVGWYFAKYLSEVLGGVPVGMILSAWGGSRIETWMDGGKNYNGMIHPLRHFTAKGFLWFQGCAQADNASSYAKLMKEMVGFWRNRWEDEEMPFYFAQLAPFKYQNPQDNWYGLMVEQQAKATGLIPHSAMASTTDLGEKDNIHFARKKEVGQRLAMLALSNDYGVDGLPAHAPSYHAHEIMEDGTVRIWMNNLSRSWWGPNTLPVREWEGFEVAGEDRIFHPAAASTPYHWRDNCIDVKCADVPHPVAVRYAFRNWSGGNVVTTLGQPLIPFRTDDWPVPEIGYGHDLPIVIFDTDLGNDIDDVLALQMLLNAEKNGELALMGITSSKSNPASACFADAYCASQGRRGIPVAGVSDGPNPDMGNYLLPALSFIGDGRKTDYPEAWRLLRRLLSVVKNGSVHLIATGPLTNLARLLESGPDSLSALCGQELVRQKVADIRIMAGSYTNQDSPEWNIVQDVDAAELFFGMCPVPVIASGSEIGSSYRYPYSALKRDFPEKHPLRVAYDHFLRPPYNRPSWDMTAVLDLLDASAFKKSAPTCVTVMENGEIEVSEQNGGLVRWLLLPGAESVMEQMIKYIK